MTATRMSARRSSRPQLSGKDDVLGKIDNGMKAILRREKSRKLEREIEVIDDCLVVP